MKTKIISIVVMLMMACNVMAQDYMMVYFKDKSFRKFYLKDITSIATKKLDADGIQHSDYEFQHITTHHNKYVYNLNEVDSITFSSIDEEAAERNFAVGMFTIFPIIGECTSIKDVEEKINLIRNAEGVETAWSDGHVLNVKIKEDEIYTFHFSHDTEMDADSAAITEAFRTMMPRLAPSIKEDGKQMKAVIANQQHKDMDRDWHKSTFFMPIQNLMESFNIHVDYVDEPTIDFFYENCKDNPEDVDHLNIYDYDIIWLITHGSYSQLFYYIDAMPGIFFPSLYGHSFLTSEDMMLIKSSSFPDTYEDYVVYFKALREWRNNHSYNDATDQQIRFGFVDEIRSDGYYWVGHPSLTEFFFRDIVPQDAKFLNPNSIFFNISCQSLKGEDDDTPSFSFAERFIERGLGTYLGYDETNGWGQRTGHSFFLNLLNGKSLQMSYDLLSDELRNEQMEEDGEKFVASLLIYPENNPTSQQCFIYPTYTLQVSQEVANNGYKSSGIVEVNANATVVHINDFKYGFFYGTDRNLLDTKDEISITEDNPIMFPKFLDNLQGNIKFRTQLKNLQPGNTYYYCAYTFDGLYYNCGDTLSFYVPFELQLSTQDLSVTAGSTTTVEITSGNGGYTLYVDKPNIATATLSGTTISIKGEAKGTAKVTVKDKSGQTAEINVTVKEFISPYCPDNNHPHLIDLGLPSGTLWACCNVEATSPELSGGYYAWGETNTKDIYSWNTYSLCNGTKSSCRHIGDDIAGTEYDVAHVKWGGQWVMPSKEQIRELLDNCTQETITLNGVNGTLVNGKNGSSIFMPFSGFRSGGSLEDEGTKSDFWSSSLYPSNEYYAYHFFFQSGGGYSSNSGYNYRYYGFSVRPIVSRELKLSQNKVEIFVGKSATVDIVSGSGNYTVSELKSSVATVSLSGTVITINGVGAGTTLVNVEDKETGQKTVIHVTVNPVYDLVISQSSVGLLIGRSCTVEITSGNGSYEISNSNQNVVKAVLDGKTITLTAIAEGTSIVTVKDKVTDQTASVSVTVTPIPNLVVSQSTIDLSVGAEGTVEIVSGSGEYSVAVDKPSIATVSLSGSVIKVKGLKSGSAAVTITDTASGQNRVLFVNVSLSYVPAEAIDLGLPSGTKWASWNVGATAPEVYGGYYAWGETEEKDYYDWNTYSLYDESSSTYHYIGNDIAGTQYDVAHVKWGGSWRIPTNDQINELLNNCTWTWTTRNEVDGELVTGPNGATIFLPAADCRLRDIGGDASRGYYWTSSVNPSYIHHAYALDFYNNRYYSSYEQRRMGCSVRPVYSDDPPQNLSVSADCIFMDKGDTTIVKIASGSGLYELSNSNNDIISAIINYSEITIIAKASGQADLTVKDTYTDQTAEINVLVVRPISYVPADTVNLGLPSGTLWASWNVGAASPDDIGGYYAWGETEEKDSYDWNTYIHCDGTGETCHHIGDNIAGTEYDVAHVKWGGFWRMPSTDQIGELFTNCTKLWTTQNGMKGMLFTGPNGNTIFLPASGYRRKDLIDSGGVSGMYWASYSIEGSWAYYLSSTLGMDWGMSERCYGLSVRPVINGLTISNNNIELMYGYSTTVEITSGNGNYEISNSDANVIQAVLEGNKITLITKAEGTAIVTVKDIVTRQTASISITVTPVPDLVISQNSVRLLIRESATVEISSGSGKYTVSVDNPNVVKATLSGSTITIESIEAGTAIVVVKDSISNQTIDINIRVFDSDCPAADAIDLGLPSGTLWASWNVGSLAPEEYGGYYAWGETEIKDFYSASTYAYWRKYIGNDIAGTEYDVAHVKWGDSWRMPSINDFKELFIICTQTWMTQNGVNGVLLTGPNGNSIFLPAAGFYLYNFSFNSDLQGYYWSSSLDPQDSDGAQFPIFISDGWTLGADSRYVGHPVRPILKISNVANLQVSSHDVKMIVGDSSTVNIISGSGSYSVQSSDTLVATAIVTGSDVLITGVDKGTATIIVYDNLTPGCAIIDVTVKPKKKPQIPAEAIDLGLPSGTKWASWNIGASAPEDYGGYYAWGETVEKDNYNWSTYKYCTGTVYNYLMTKYCTNSDYGNNGFTDGLRELLPYDDAATANWGAPWHMPTMEQQKELIDNCTREWTQLNGVNGVLVTGPNGNSIFLPAAGYRWDDKLDNEGSSGVYWSSSLFLIYPDSAYRIYFDSESWNLGINSRYTGRSVRAVCP